MLRRSYGTSDRATLPLIVRGFILPGTAILNNQWAACNNTASVPNNYKYQTVNHSVNFDPETHTHTQNIENM